MAGEAAPPCPFLSRATASLFKPRHRPHGSPPIAALLCRLPPSSSRLCSEPVSLWCPALALDDVVQDLPPPEHVWPWCSAAGAAASVAGRAVASARMPHAAGPAPGAVLGPQADFGPLALFHFSNFLIIFKSL
jgi:hypothetical protein